MKKKWLVLAILLIALFAVFVLVSNEETTETQGEGKTEEGGAVQGQLDQYAVVIDSCRVSEDYEGKPVVIIKYLFTNVSDDDASSFALSISDSVFQNGVGLNEAYVLSDSAHYSSDNQMKDIKKGATIEVEVAYELNDAKTPIDVEVEESFSFKEKKVTKRFTFE